MKKCVWLILVVASTSWSKECPTGMEPFKDGCAVVESGSNWRSDEKPRHKRAPAWETGEVNALMPAAQTWDATTGGTEIADKIKWAAEHPYIQPVADAGKPSTFTK